MVTGRLHHEGRRYWSLVPLSSMSILLAAVFLTFSSVAFVSDLAEPRPSPYWWVMVYAANTGVVAVGYALISTRFVRAWPVAIAANLLTIVALPRILPLYSSKVAPDTPVVALHQRHVLDAWLVFAVLFLGYVLFFTFVSMEGTKYFRLRAEVELAERVQAELVPPLHLNAGDLEICGKSIPSSTVGGDLVDAVIFDNSVTCYLADVSGHGIAAAVLMSMVKSAVRASIFQGEPLVDLMRHMNQALFQLKEPNMFVTLACLRPVDGKRVEYALAAHPPILHYRAITNTVSFLKMEQLPIAMFRETTFETNSIALATGDVLVIVSDGFLEVTNDRGEECGWERLERVILKNAAEPLTQIIARLVDETIQFGSQRDDQTILLVKAAEQQVAA